MLRIILISCLTFSTAFACPNNVQKIKAGEPAPCSAWLVSEPTMQEMARNKDELETSKKLILAQEHLQKLTEEEAEFYKRRASAREKELEKAEVRSFWKTAGAFALGVVVTGLAAKAAIEASR